MSRTEADVKFLVGEWKRFGSLRLLINHRHPSSATLSITSNLGAAVECDIDL